MDARMADASMLESGSLRGRGRDGSWKIGRFVRHGEGIKIARAIAPKNLNQTDQIQENMNFVW